MSAESFPYTQGRITHQRRGANVVSATGGDYHYYAGKNQLERVSLGMDVAKEAQRNRSAKGTFVYDLDGNLIEDKSKEMTILYDYRGMPREMTRAVVSAEGMVDSVRLTMFYDGSGNRITKRYERKGVSDASWQLQLATHYTGLGSEIRERDSSAKVVVNMPQGLGRYTVSDAQKSASESFGFEWYLKNHLGSTMLVFGTGSGSAGVKAAYDYRAFGERVSLVVSSEKVTEEFTGKELDAETGLNYFIHRYYDAELGVWVSVDPKRQFPSPYLYGPNNPINGFDTDGRIWKTIDVYTTNQIGNLLFNGIAMLSEGQTVAGKATSGIDLNSKESNLMDIRVQMVKQMWVYDPLASSEKNARHPSGTIRTIPQIRVNRQFANDNFVKMYGLDVLENRSQEKAWDPFVFDETYYEFAEPMFYQGQRISADRHSNPTVEAELESCIGCSE